MSTDTKETLPGPEAPDRRVSIGIFAILALIIVGLVAFFLYNQFSERSEVVELVEAVEEAYPNVEADYDALANIIDGVETEGRPQIGVIRADDRPVFGSNNMTVDQIALYGVSPTGNEVLLAPGMDPVDGMIPVPDASVVDPNDGDGGGTEHHHGHDHDDTGTDEPGEE